METMNQYYVFLIFFKKFIIIQKYVGNYNVLNGVWWNVSRSSAITGEQNVFKYWNGDQLTVIVVVKIQFETVALKLDIL